MSGALAAARREAEEALDYYSMEPYSVAEPASIAIAAIQSLLAATEPGAGEREEKRDPQTIIDTIRWVLNDAHYKAPEQIAGHWRTLWAPMLRTAIDAMPVGVPALPPRPAPSPETPGTTYTEALDGNTHASGTDGGQNGGSDAASREGAAVLGVQPADGALADRTPGRVPLAVPVLRSGETRGPVTPPPPAQDAVREAAERAGKAMRDVLGGVDQFGDYYRLRRRPRPAGGGARGGAR